VTSASATTGKQLDLDLASLEQMRRVRLEAAEPFLKRRVMFEGVLLADLLAVAGVPESATKVSLTALDDYKVDFTVAKAALRPGMTAAEPGGCATATAPGCTPRRSPPTCSRTPTSAAWC
jgi:hypothetical protein